MNRPVNSSLDFINSPVESKPTTGSVMITGLTDNPKTFPNPPVAVADLTTANDNLSGAVTNARSGDKTASATLINVEKKWDIAFRGTAKYVSTVASGDAEVILLGGCTPTKSETTPAQIPGECKNVEIAAEHGAGTASAGCDADSTVKAYLVIAATSGATIKQDGNMLIITVGTETIYVQADTHRKTLLHNLTGGEKLSVSMLGLNNAGCGPLSSAKTIIPQE